MKVSIIQTQINLFNSIIYHNTKSGEQNIPKVQSDLNKSQLKDSPQNYLSKVHFSEYEIDTIKLVWAYQANVL